MLPSFFLAHGTPALVLENNEYTRFLRMLALQLPLPKAVVIFSSHWESHRQLISAAVQYETIHDFFGFPEQLYQITYPAKGDITLAYYIQSLLSEEGIGSELNDTRGLDHGSWSLLTLMYPSADVPVIAMSVQPNLTPEEQYRIGKALAPLRNDNVLIIGSGGTVHNLEQLDWTEAAEAQTWASTFDCWLAEQLETWHLDELFDYEYRGPYARRAAPSPEHFAPLLLAMGAADVGKKAKLLHRQYQFGTLSLSAWMFG
jgi:4,5-DOPA dioxygenase extradiol